MRKRNFRKLLRESTNSVFRPFGFELVRFLPENQYYPVTQISLEERQDIITSELHRSLSSTEFEASTQAIRTAVSNFDEIFQQCPVQQTIGGSGYNAAVTIYTLSRLINPDKIVESGVFKGLTTWLLRNAVPNAQLFAFDVDLTQRQYICNDVTYYECDWSEKNISSTKNSLVMFDDHVSHAKRIVEAADRGFKLILFDDDYPLAAPYIDTTNIIPTVSMIVNSKIDSLKTLEWKIRDKNYLASLDTALIQKARARITRVEKLPSLASVTGFRPCHLTLCFLN